MNSCQKILSHYLRKIKPPGFSLPEYQNTIYAVLADLDLPIYITTNYDHFMESALESKGKRPTNDFCSWTLGYDDMDKNNTDYKPT